MFVPSLSWQMDHFYINTAQKVPSPYLHRQCPRLGAGQTRQRLASQGRGPCISPLRLPAIVAQNFSASRLRFGCWPELVLVNPAAHLAIKSTRPLFQDQLRVAPLVDSRSLRSAPGTRARTKAWSEQTRSAAPDQTRGH
jgi:hypothetical protein